MPTSVTIRPEDDPVAQVLGGWLAEFERTYKNPAHKFRKLAGRARVSRSRVEDEIQTSEGEGERVERIVFYGHGTSCSLCTRDGNRPGGDCRPRIQHDDCDHCCQCSSLPLDESLLDVNNAHVCSTKEVYAVACWTARKLAGKVLSKGGNGTAFFGYERQLHLPPRITVGSADITDRMGAVVNNGLTILHDIEAHASTMDRLRTVAKAVRGGFLDLARDIRTDASTGRYGQVLEVFVAHWRRSFVPQAVTENGVVDL